MSLKGFTSLQLGLRRLDMLWAEYTIDGCINDEFVNKALNEDKECIEQVKNHLWIMFKTLANDPKNR